MSTKNGNKFQSHGTISDIAKSFVKRLNLIYKQENDYFIYCLIKIKISIETLSPGVFFQLLKGLNFRLKKNYTIWPLAFLC